jgi:glycosyltransferase involved in cell wall biosynthesis
MRRLQLQTLYPVYCSGRAITHICLSVLDHMQGEALGVEYWAPALAPGVRRPYLRTPLPSLAARALYRLQPSGGALQSILERRFVSSLGPGDVAYLWPAVRLETYRRVKEKGHRILVERINCHRQTSRRILDAEYARLGLPPTHGITEAAVREEREKLALADHVFSPGAPVTESLLDAGVPAARILRSSYGYDPSRLAAATPRPVRHEPVFLFVGRGIVRKGLPFLLDVWARAGVRGRLHLSGAIDPEVQRLCAAWLARPDVVQLGYHPDVAAVYQGADVFVFPTREEGSPLVSYEAAASGLPGLLSPMGAGDFVRDGREGLVLDPGDADAWISAIRRLATDPDLRRALGEAARARAEDFTWARVGERRRALLEAALAGGRAS